MSRASQGGRRRLAVRLVLVVALLVAGLALATYRPAPSLPDGLVPEPGTYDVRILRDDYGVPHIFGRTDADAAYGLAFAHAEDDFPTMQGALLAARGKLASVYGKDAAPNDYMVALLQIDAVVDAGYPRLPADTRALCEAYADGLNHYAALHPDDALAALYPVEGRDVVAGFVHKLPLFFGIDKVLKGVLDGSLPGLEGYDEIRGSNAFALGPRKTDDGSTVLVVNSHQPWEGPVAWYEAHVRSEEGWDAVGGLFPGAPVILVGHNRRLGWAHTVNKPDLIDVYRLRLDEGDPDQYILDGEAKRLEKSRAAIDVKLWGPFHWTFTRDVWASVHGPVLRTEEGAFALRYAGFGGVAQVDQWYRMNRADDLESFQAAMDGLAFPMFNTVYADADGHIGYLYNARLPRRPADPSVDYAGVLPGDRSELIWSHDEPFARRELPQVWDPDAAYVQSCNNSPFRATDPSEDVQPSDLPADMVATAGFEARMTNRSLRALELLGADPQITDAELKTYKFDTTYHPDSAFSRLLDRAIALRPTEDLSPEALSSEDLSTEDLSSEDLSAEDLDLLTRAQEVLQAFDRETDLADPHAALAVRAVGPFIEPPRTVDDATLAASVQDAARDLEARFGRLQVPWGEVNRLRRGSVDLPLAGAPDVLHAVYSKVDDDGRLRGTAGDCYVLFARWAPDGTVRSESLHQYGAATLDDTSPHYADQAPLFAERRLKKVYYEEAEIRSHLEAEYRPGERP